MSKTNPSLSQKSITAQNVPSSNTQSAEVNQQQAQINPNEKYEQYNPIDKESTKYYKSNQLKVEKIVYKLR